MEIDMTHASKSTLINNRLHKPADKKGMQQTLVPGSSVAKGTTGKRSDNGRAGGVAGEVPKGKTGKKTNYGRNGGVASGYK